MLNWRLPSAEIRNRCLENFNSESDQQLKNSFMFQIFVVRSSIFDIMGFILNTK